MTMRSKFRATLARSFEVARRPEAAGWCAGAGAGAGAMADWRQQPSCWLSRQAPCSIPSRRDTREVMLYRSLTFPRGEEAQARIASHCG